VKIEQKGLLGLCGLKIIDFRRTLLKLEILIHSNEKVAKKWKN